MEATEEAWLEGVSERLLGAASGIDSETKRTLLRLTKTTADATGIRYLAPLTAYLIGRAVGRAEAGGESFDLGAASGAINDLAAGLDRAPGD